MQQCFGGTQRNEEKGEWETEKKKHSRKTKQPTFTNKFIDTLFESSSDKDEGNVI